MKVAIISDLHSNREALEAVFAHIQSLGISSVYCLGDVIGYGPEPEFCVELVRGHAQLCLMGNHDEGLFRDASDFNPHARGALEYTKERMQPSWFSLSEKKARWKWLEELVLTHRELAGRTLRDIVDALGARGIFVKRGRDFDQSFFAPVLGNAFGSFVQHRFDVRRAQSIVRQIA